MANMQGTPEYKDNMEELTREPATPQIFNKRYQTLLNNDAYLEENKLDKTGDAKDVVVTFEEVNERENINDKETLSTLFGKVKKFFSDLKTVAFTGSYKDLTDKPAAKDIEAAPISHASTATTYGASSATNYGHAMASSTTPKANGTAAVGTETAKFARGDHVHPLQTSVSGSSGSCTGNSATATKATQDGNGNNIVNTYLQKSGGVMSGNLSLSGKNRINIGNYSGSTAYIESGGTANTINLVLGNPSNTSAVHAMRFTARDDYATLESYDDTKLDLGAGGNRRFRNIYAQTGSINTSDLREKKNISYIGETSGYDTAMTDEQLEKLIMGIKPIIFRYKDNDSNRPHHGIGAQDFEELLKKIGLFDHAALIKSPALIEERIDTGNTDDEGNPIYVSQFKEIEGEYHYGFRYAELVTDTIRFIQIQQKRINILEKRLQVLESFLEEITTNT